MRKIVKIILLTLLLIIAPIVAYLIIFGTGTIKTSLVIGTITFLSIGGVVMLFIKKRKVLAIYVLVLGIIIGGASYVVLRLNNIIYEGKSLTFEEKVKRQEAISSGEYTIEELTAKYIKNRRLAKYDSKIEKGNKTFYYKSSKVNPEKSIEFIEDTLSKSMEGYGKYLGYTEEKPSEIFLSSILDSEQRGYVDGSNQIEIGLYEFYIDGGKLQEAGLDSYRKTITHEYIHFIEGTYLRSGKVYINTPSWFSEGLASYITNEIYSIKDESGEMYPLDLTLELREHKNRYDDFYISSSRVIREIYKEVGAEGIINILKLSAEMNFDKALKEVTGKELEDYYYIFKG